MLHSFRTILITALLTNSCFAGAVDLSGAQSRLSYSIGNQIGGDFKRQGIDIEPQIVLQGIQDAMEGVAPAMSEEEMQSTLVALQKSVIESQKKKVAEVAAKNLEAGRTFLVQNGKKADIITLPSGLLYKIISEGAGESPSATDVVEVNYLGTLIDGTEFDSSYKRGKAAQFRVDKVIKGWTEAFQLMRAGGKWQLFIPPELAYGSRRAGGIEPNSTLIFDVELLAILNKR